MAAIGNRPPCLYPGEGFPLHDSTGENLVSLKRSGKEYVMQCQGKTIVFKGTKIPYIVHSRTVALTVVKHSEHSIKIIEEKTNSEDSSETYIDLRTKQATYYDLSSPEPLTPLQAARKCSWVLQENPELKWIEGIFNEYGVGVLFEKGREIQFYWASPFEPRVQRIFLKEGTDLFYHFSEVEKIGRIAFSFNRHRFEVDRSGESAEIDEMPAHFLTEDRVTAAAKEKPVLLDPAAYV